MSLETIVQTFYTDIHIVTFCNSVTRVEGAKFETGAAFPVFSSYSKVLDGAFTKIPLKNCCNWPTYLFCNPSSQQLPMKSECCVNKNVKNANKQKHKYLETQTHMYYIRNQFGGCLPADFFAQILQIAGVLRSKFENSRSWSWSRKSNFWIWVIWSIHRLPLADSLSTVGRFRNMLEGGGDTTCWGRYNQFQTESKLTLQLSSHWREHCLLTCSNWTIFWKRCNFILSG